jgi:Ca-activated chloride channel family protein
MKKIAFAVFCFGVAVAGVAAQTTRPRVVQTPQGQAPTLKNDAPATNAGRRPPVLIGGQTRPSTATQPAASPTPPVAEEDEVVKVETSIVTMPVSVIDRDGRFVSGLTQNDFRVFENGVEQKVAYFQSVEQPFTVVLMLDVSPSTQWQIEDIQRAAITFIDQLRPNDRVMVIAFDDKVHVLSQATNNRAQLRRAIQQAEIGDGTSLYESVDYVLNQELPRIQGRKAVVLFTDGVDTTSRRANYQSTVTDVEESEALFYPIRYNTQRDNNPGGWGGGGRRRRGDWTDAIGIILGGGNVQLGQAPAGSSSQEYATGLRYLETLANNTGGRKYEADSLYNLDAAFSGIAEELRRQYSLGYYPDKVGQRGDRKQIKIRVMRPNLVVRAKTSYIVGQNDPKYAGK